MKIDNELVNEAFQRWARTKDGRTFYVGLQKILMAVPGTIEPGALQENLGRRRLAQELMAVMAEGMVETKPSDDPRARPVIFSLTKPVAVAGANSRGARRRVSASPEPDASPEPGTRRR
jgi:hypothetical protein